MPISPYLAGRQFPPETITVMNVALDKVCGALQTADLGSRTMVARTIIALVEDGKTDTDQIAAVAIEEIRKIKRAKA